MNAIVALFALFAVAQAGVIAPIVAPAAVAGPTVLTRAPAFDSAVIKSDRLGGNFAYSVAENHAYAAHTPIVQTVASPVAVSYAAAAPAVAAYTGLGYAGYPYGYAAGLGYNGFFGAPATTIVA